MTLHEIHDVGSGLSYLMYIIALMMITDGTVAYHDVVHAIALWPAANLEVLLCTTF